MPAPPLWRRRFRLRSFSEIEGIGGTGHRPLWPVSSFAVADDKKRSSALLLHRERVPGIEILLARGVLHFDLKDVSARLHLLQRHFELPLNPGLWIERAVALVRRRVERLQKFAIRAENRYGPTQVHLVALDRK